MHELINGIHSIAVRSNHFNDALEPEEVQDLLLPHIEEHFIPLLVECDGDIGKAWNEFRNGTSHIDIAYALNEDLEDDECCFYDGISHVISYNLMRNVISDPKVLHWLMDNPEVQDLHYAWYVANEECDCECA